MKYFDDYVLNYDMTDPDIIYKYHHSYRVMELISQIAIKLNLSKEDIYLAKVIGLLHDIGRFEQDKLYNSFKESNNIDHGQFGVEIIKENNLLDKANIKKDDYEIVYKAIYNHNKLTISNNLNEREELFSKLIRDADKLDILYALGSSQYNILSEDDQEISENIFSSFFNQEIINKKEVKNKNEALILRLGFIYDIYFHASYEIINKNKYYDKIYNQINNKNIFKKYIDYANKYIQERID